jgi:Glycosyl transferase family 11
MSHPAVIARLFGGLGNQLFIYAFARALAERNGVPVRFDVAGGFERDPVYRRRFLLDRLLPDIEPAGRWRSRTFPLGRTLRSLDRKINKLLPLQRRWFIQERRFAFDPDIYHLKIARPTVFNGVWQSPRYFDNLDMAALVQFPPQLTGPLDAELAPIPDSNAVCLAIRRYEEVRNQRIHVLEADYFNRAMARLEQQVENPHYFVFAQDMDWARANITSRHPVTFASSKDPYDGVIQDLYLMTQCRHFILSNSSLHWWAAWLGRGPDGIVIAPDQEWPYSDILPAEWTGLA